MCVCVFQWPARPKVGGSGPAGCHRQRPSAGALHLQTDCERPPGGNRQHVSDRSSAGRSGVREGKGSHENGISPASSFIPLHCSCSQDSSSGGPRQRKPHPHVAQQLPRPPRFHDQRRPGPRPLPVGPRPPESCCWGQLTLSVWICQEIAI